MLAPSPSLRRSAPEAPRAQKDQTDRDGACKPTRWNDDSKDIVNFVHCACKYKEELMRRLCTATQPSTAAGLEAVLRYLAGGNRSVLIRPS